MGNIKMLEVEKMSTLHIDYTEKDSQGKILGDFRISINMVANDGVGQVTNRKIAEEACLAAADAIRTINDIEIL